LNHPPAILLVQVLRAFTTSTSLLSGLLRWAVLRALMTVVSSQGKGSSIPPLRPYFPIQP
ncbi:hypothetical protein ACRALDRAFT_1060716, partial [Sodiomyces alcalophilus JCM 7366]|uniref:uncharacterized protein n=1 Tax=Sodiomyces alcalophilus JCM 7366 TaxID=591952 RepID=UPI0039B6A083